MRPDARFSEVARRYGIAERVLFRWKQEITPAAATDNAGHGGMFRNGAGLERMPPAELGLDRMPTPQAHPMKDGLSLPLKLRPFHALRPQ